MTCAGVCEALPLYVGGDLSVSEAAQVQQHLNQCSSCEHEWQTFQAAHADLLSLTPSSLSEPLPLWAAVEERLSAVDAVQRHQRHQRPFWRKPVAWTSLAAAMLLALLPTLLSEDVSPDLSLPSMPRSAHASDLETLRQAPEGSALVPVPDAVLRDFLLNNGAMMENFLLGTASPFAQPVGLTHTDL